MRLLDPGLEVVIPLMFPSWVASCCSGYLKGLIVNFVPTNKKLTVKIHEIFTVPFFKELCQSRTKKFLGNGKVKFSYKGLIFGHKTIVSF